MDKRDDMPGMTIVDYPAVSFAKKVCLVAMLICVIILGIYYTSSPTTKQLILANQYWVVIVLGTIVGISAIVAFVQALRH